MSAMRPGETGATRTCPHCKTTILESAAVCPACRGHLRTCAACRDLADQQTRLRAALADLPPAEPPAHLWAAIDARVGAAEIADSRRGALATG